MYIAEKHSSEIRESVYRSCVGSEMLYGSETWCLCQNEKGILQRAERAMMRSMCRVELMDENSTKDLMDMLDLCEAIDQLASVFFLSEYFLRRTLDLRVKLAMKMGRPKKTWLTVVVEQSRKVWMDASDANSRLRWKLGVSAIHINMRHIWPPPLFGDKSGF